MDVCCKICDPQALYYTFTNSTWGCKSHATAASVSLLYLKLNQRINVITVLKPHLSEPIMTFWKLLTTTNSPILPLLDSSAAFDSVDYTISLSRLTNRFGIRDTALNWFRSYLQLYIKQFLSVNGIDSSLKDLQYGVPQRPVFMVLYCILFTQVDWVR